MWEYVRILIFRVTQHKEIYGMRFKGGSWPGIRSRYQLGVYEGGYHESGRFMTR